MTKQDNNTTIQELKDLVVKFSRDRNWQKHHKPKNLTMGIAIEAAELMEHYQWENTHRPNMDEVSDELADILFNLLNFAYIEKLDVTKSFINKFKKIEKKYPLSKFNKDRNDLEEYLQIKKAYRAKRSK